VPERSSQDEIGLRFAVDHRLSLSSSVYRASRQNVFVVLVDQVGNDVASVFSYRVRGWESDLNATPLPGWTLNANLTLQIPKIDSYPQTPANVGNAVPSVPSRLANLWTSYDLALADPIGVIRGSVAAHYRNREYADAGQTRLVPGAATFDAGLALPRERWTLAIGANNFLDRRNFLYGDGTGGGALPGPGRTLFGRLSATLW
jgi:outer membrane receptor for monomeric catechols